MVAASASGSRLNPIPSNEQPVKSRNRRPPSGEPALVQALTGQLVLRRYFLNGIAFKQLNRDRDSYQQQFKSEEIAPKPLPHGFATV